MTSSNSNTRYKKNKKNFDKKKKQNENKSNAYFYVFAIVIFILTIAVNNLSISNKLTKIDNKLENINKEITLEDIAPHYVFLGDSITKQYDLSKYFKGYSVVNSGEDGNQTEHLLENMEKRVYRYNPSSVFLMIGTNDINDNKSVEYIFENIKQIIEEIQINLPNTKIIIQSMVPSHEKWSKYDNNDKRKKVNALLSKEYKDTNIKYIDLYSMLENEDNGKLREEYTEDGLHLNDKAYKLIANELKKHMTMKNKIK